MEWKIPPRLFFAYAYAGGRTQGPFTKSPVTSFYPIYTETIISVALLPPPFSSGYNPLSIYPFIPPNLSNYRCRRNYDRNCSPRRHLLPTCERVSCRRSSIFLDTINHPRPIIRRQPVSSFRIATTVPATTRYTVAVSRFTRWNTPTAKRTTALPHWIWLTAAVGFNIFQNKREGRPTLRGEKSTIPPIVADHSPRKTGRGSRSPTFPCFTFWSLLAVLTTSSELIRMPCLVHVCRARCADLPLVRLPVAQHLTGWCTGLSPLTSQVILTVSHYRRLTLLAGRLFLVICMLSELL